MKFRELGCSGFRLSELGFGAWGIGGAQWKGGTDAESLQALHRAFELGVNLVDTALAYGAGHSEKLVGQAIKNWGGTVFVATKIPPKNHTWPAPAGATIHDVFPADYVEKSTDISLRNLGTSVIDLQQLHVWNSRWTPQDEWRRAFEKLKKSGKVRFVGVSLTEHDPDSGLELIETGLVDAVQVIYNIFDPSAAERLFPLCERLGVGVLARVPLDEGSLTGTINAHTDFDGDEFRANYFRGDRKKQVAERVSALQRALLAAGIRDGLPEIAIRFCLTPAAVTSVIPGMRRVRNVESNVKASERGALSPETLTLLESHQWKRNFYE